MMENNGHKSNGFLLGAILGVGLALLFTTKKGKKIVKVLTENGLDGIDALSGFFESEEEYEEEIGDQIPEEPQLNTEKAEEEIYEEAKVPQSKPVHHQNSSKPHRFFKRKK